LKSKPKIKCGKKLKKFEKSIAFCKTGVILQVQTQIYPIGGN